MAEKTRFFAHVPGHVDALLQTAGDFEYLGVVVRSGGLHILCICRRQVKDAAGSNDRKFVPVDYMSTNNGQAVPQGFLNLFNHHRPRTPQSLTQVRELLGLPERELHDAETLGLVRMRSEILGEQTRPQD